MPSNGKAHPDTSIVTVDTNSGAIRTMLSGKNFMEDELALATDPHPTGSAFKPFVLAAAFEQGVPPTQTYSSASPFCSPLWDDDDNCVENAEGSGSGKVDLWTATEDSINVVFAQLILDIGPETVPPVAAKMGVTADLPPVASLATGSAEVSPLDMAVGLRDARERRRALHAVHGARRSSATATRSTSTRPTASGCCGPTSPTSSRPCCERVPASGTAASAFYGWGTRPVAGKTGTADLNKAVWFCGYTRQLATAVWVGSNGNPYSLGSVFGGSVAAPIWRDYMARAVNGMPVEGFPEPPPPPTATVPNVVGLTQGEGHRPPRRKPASTCRSWRSTRSKPEGIVAAQSPAGGATVDLGIAVKIEVSSGKPPKTEVPGTIGMPEGAARAAIEQAGFAVEVVYEQVKDESKVGEVVRQDPPGGTPAAEGSTVTLVVGKKGGGG